MNQLQLFVNNILGKKSIMDVTYQGQSFKLDITAKREIKRAKEIFHESALLEKMFSNIIDGDVIYDIGANIGVISLLLAGHPSTENSVIQSFEPESKNYNQLKKNIMLNDMSKSIIPHQLALGIEKGTIDLFVRGHAGEGRHSIAESKGSTGTVSVNIESCSVFAESSGTIPDLVKIDVEGAEGQVLAGMENMMNQHNKPRDIFLEIHNKGDKDMMPDGQTNIDSWLISRGYRLEWEQTRRSGSNRHYTNKS